MPYLVIQYLCAKGALVMMTMCAWTPQTGSRQATVEREMHGCKQQSYRTRSPCVSAPKKGEKTNPPKNDNTNKKYETLSAPTPKC